MTDPPEVDEIVDELFESLFLAIQALFKLKKFLIWETKISAMSESDFGASFVS